MKHIPNIFIKYSSRIMVRIFKIKYTHRMVQIQCIRDTVIFTF